MQGWRWWSQQQAEKGSVLYNAVSAAARANDVAKAKDAMAQLADKYGGTAYAPRAALIVAATLYDAGDKAGAKAQLAAVIDRDSEDELKQIARLRLAAMLFDDKQYDDALRTLDAKHDDAFAGIYADMRGDILARRGPQRRKRAPRTRTRARAPRPEKSLSQLRAGEARHAGRRRDRRRRAAAPAQHRRDATVRATAPRHDRAAAGSTASAPATAPPPAPTK